MTQMFRLVASALFIALTSVSLESQEGSGVIHGFVREAATGEAVPLATLSVDAGAHRTTAGRDGYFRVLQLTPGEHRVLVRAPGFTPLDTTVAVSGRPIELRLLPAPVELAGITVRAPQAGERPLEDPEISVRTVTPAQVRRVPAALEADIFRAVQALPGVTAPSVFSSQLLVRGGAADQNLFLLDGYPVIHPYHLTGAFSTFHVDAVRDAEFWLAAPPARYGGRLSSVLDVALREGNREERMGTASVGVVSSSAVVEGPHGRGAWFAGVRSTYLDLVTGALGQEVPYRFYDAYAKAYADLSPSDRVSALVFLGRDGTWRAETRSDHFDWANDVVGVSWRHLFGGHAVFEQRLSVSRFTEKLDTGFTALHNAGIRTDHHLLLAAARGELRLDLSSRNRIEAGYSLERQTGEHRVVYLTGLPRFVREERAMGHALTTAALYLQDDITAADALRLRLGLRAERNDAGGQSLQPRITAKYLLSDRVALTVGGGWIRQYGHLLQDPDIQFDIYTADIWLPSADSGIPSGDASHLVGGAEARLPGGLRLRVEAYEKRFGGLVTLAPYDPVDRRFAIQRLEQATGQARGIDLSLGREAEGPVRGWIGYSLAASERTVERSSFLADPHPRQRLVAVWDMETGRRWGFTGRFEAFEGVPFTPAVAMVPRRPFDFGHGRITSQCSATQIEYLYGARNSARTEWSKRLDLGTGRRWTDRRGRRWELSLSVLNALFDPVGVFRPATASGQTGCETPAEVLREREVLLPPIPSVGIRVEF
jgi:hypothetical protein